MNKPALFCILFTAKYNILLVYVRKHWKILYVSFRTICTFLKNVLIFLQILDLPTLEVILIKIVCNWALFSVGRYGNVGCTFWLFLISPLWLYKGLVWSEYWCTALVGVWFVSCVTSENHKNGVIASLPGGKTGGEWKQRCILRSISGAVVKMRQLLMSIKNRFDTLHTWEWPHKCEVLQTLCIRQRVSSILCDYNMFLKYFEVLLCLKYV